MHLQSKKLCTVSFRKAIATCNYSMANILRVNYDSQRSWHPIVLKSKTQHYLVHIKYSKYQRKGLQVQFGYIAKT